MIKRIFSISLIFSFIFALNIHAKEIENYDIDFKTAYELMMNNNNAIKALVEEVKVKKYKKNSALGQFAPKVVASADFVHFNKDIETGDYSANTPMGQIPIPSITIQDRNVGGLGLSALWNVFCGGKIIALNKKARAELLGANLKYQSTSNFLTTKLIQSYYGLVLMKNVALVRKEVFDTTKDHLEDAKKMEREGIIPKSQRLHAEVASRQAKKDYEASIKDVEIAQEMLKSLIKDESANLNNVSVNPTSLLFMPNKDAKDLYGGLDNMKQIAFQDNPDFKQSEVQKKLANANYSANIGNYMPNVSLFAYDALATYNLMDQIPRFGVGASVNMVLFDGFSRYNDLKAAGALKKEAKYSEILAKNNIESKITKDYNELLKYKEEFESSEKTLESAKESLRCARIGFREGVSTSLDVTDAQSSLSAVKIQRLNALYNYDVKLAELLQDINKSESVFEYIENANEENL